MGVDLRGLDAGMPEQLLDDAKIGPMLEQMGGETVPEHVRRQGTLNTGLAGAFFDAAPEGGRMKGRAAAGEKDGARGSGPNQLRATQLQVALQGGDGLPANRDDALLVALANHAQKAAFKV